MYPDLIARAFSFSNEIFVRLHGPAGYTDYTSYKPWLRDEFKFRCIYCLEGEQWSSDPAGSTSADHFRPKSTNSALINDYDNLFYACLRCNRAKLATTGVLNPSETIYGKHLITERSGVITGLTPEGNIHIEILRLNDIDRVTRRYAFMEAFQYLSKNGDSEAHAFIRYLMGYPADLPDLGKLRPPSNYRPEGVKDCAFNLRASGKLSEIY